MDELGHYFHLGRCSRNIIHQYFYSGFLIIVLLCTEIDGDGNLAGVFAESGAPPGSEVDVRIRALTHSWASGSGYLTARPILMKGGPSPRTLALASQLSDIFISRANSAGVSSRVIAELASSFEEPGMGRSSGLSFPSCFFIAVVQPWRRSAMLVNWFHLKRMWRADAKLPVLWSEMPWIQAVF
jgi:hypothetical protein